MTSYKDEKTGKWYCTFRYTDIYGKRVQKMKRGFSLKRDAEKWERDFLATEHGEQVTVGRLLKDFLVEQVQKYNVGNIKYSSLIAAQNCVRLYVMPYWENIVANNVKPLQVSDWLVKITIIDNKKKGKQAKSTKTRRSSATINRAKSILKNAFHIGQLNYKLQVNPVEEVQGLKKFSNDQRVKLWTIEQYKTFRDSLDREDMKLLFDIIFYAGLRIGEAIALTPSDITKYKISITKAVFYAKYNEMIIGTPKSKSSIRDVEIPKFLYESIQDYIKKLYNASKEERILPLNPSSVRTHMNIHIARCDLPHISPHILRHSYASHLLALTDVTVVSKQLGHSNPSITHQIYSHMVPGSDRAGVDALEEFLKNKK